MKARQKQVKALFESSPAIKQRKTKRRRSKLHSILKGFPQQVGARCGGVCWHSPRQWALSGISCVGTDCPVGQCREHHAGGAHTSVHTCAHARMHTQHLCLKCNSLNVVFNCLPFFWKHCPKTSLHETLHLNRKFFQDYRSQYCIVYLEAAQRVDLRRPHYKKKKVTM